MFLKERTKFLLQEMQHVGAMCDLLCQLLTLTKSLSENSRFAVSNLVANRIMDWFVTVFFLKVFTTQSACFALVLD